MFFISIVRHVYHLQIIHSKSIFSNVIAATQSNLAIIPNEQSLKTARDFSGCNKAFKTNFGSNAFSGYNAEFIVSMEQASFLYTMAVYVHRDLNSSFLFQVAHYISWR